MNNQWKPVSEINRGHGDDLLGVVLTVPDPWVIDRLPIDLGGGWSLRRSTSKEIADIQVQSMFETSLARHPAAYFAASEIGSTEPIMYGPNTWFHLTVEAGASVGLGLSSIQDVLLISDLDLVVGLWMSSGGFGTPWTKYHAHRVRNPMEHNEPSTVIPKWEPSTTYDERLAATKDLTNHRCVQLEDPLLTAVRRYTTRASVPAYAPEAIVLQWSLIEGMLAYKPSAGDPHGSLVKQLKRNIGVVQQQLAATEHRIDMGPFGNTPLSTIVDRLYDYRSCLVHGSDLARANKRVTDIVADPMPEQGRLLMHDWLAHLLRRTYAFALRAPDLHAALTGVGVVNA